MTLTELEQTLKAVLESQQLGQPVALRIHAQLPMGEGDPAGLVSAFRPLMRLLAEETGGHIQARQHPGGQQLSVLWTAANGRTVLLTFVCQPAVKQNLQVLLVGNHGLTRLTGGELWEQPLQPEAGGFWSDEIAQSLKQGTSIPVGAS